MTDQELLARADAIAPRAYSPYSKFHVGCAMLARDGTVFEGVNVFEASLDAAERHGVWLASRSACTHTPAPMPWTSSSAITSSPATVRMASS